MKTLIYIVFFYSHIALSQIVLHQPNQNKIRMDKGNGSARECFIFAGQSNVDAYLFTSGLEPEYQQVYTGTNFFQHSEDQWSGLLLPNVKFVPLNYADNTAYQAGNQTARYAMQFYLYPQFKTLLSVDNTYIIHHAKGGTALATEWKSTTTVGLLYRQLIFKVKATRDLFIDVDGVSPNFRFVYWGQGETDAASLSNANNYETNLTNLINNFRSATGLTNVPWLIGRIPSGIDATTFPYWNTVRTAQTNVAATLPFVYIVDQDNAELAPDNIHHTAAGYRTISSTIISVAQANGIIP